MTSVQSFAAMNRRTCLRSTVVCGVLAVGGLQALAENPKTESVFRAVELNHISLDTAVPERASEFYQMHFGMTPISHGRGGRAAFLHFDKGFLNLRRAEKSGLNHFCLGVKDFDIEKFQTVLSDLDLDPVVRGRGRLLHINDPDGIDVQIQEIAHGYGRTRNQLTNAEKGTLRAVQLKSLCLGVTDVRRSRDFYNRMFGLRAADGEGSRERCVLKVGDSFLELREADQPGMLHYGYAVSNSEPDSIRSKLGDGGVSLMTGNESGVIALRDADQIVVHVNEQGD